MARNLRVGVQRGLRQSIGGGLGTGDIFTLSPASFDFARTGTKDSRITFTRSSTGTYVAADGLIKTAASNAARFDHDLATGKSLGLLIEEARTNLVIYSEQFDNSAWTKSSGATVNLNAVAAPDGTNTGSIVNFSSSSSRFFQTRSLTAGTYTLSVFLRVSSGSKALTMQVFNSTDGSQNKNITVTDSWQKFTHTVTVSNAACQLHPVRPDDIGDVYVWGAQLEAGSFATSYIPTTSSTVTRAADVAEITGTNFSDFYNQTEGTVFAVAEAPNQTNVVVASLSNGTNNNKIEVRSSATSLTKARGVVRTAATVVFDKSPTAGTGRFRSLVLAYKATDSMFAADGLLSARDTSVPLPSVSRLYLANEFNNTDLRPGHIKRLSYFPTRLPDATLQSITS